jgi:PAS domain S-box-containing protein
MPSRLTEHKKPLRYVYIAVAGILILATGLASLVWSQISDAAQVRTSLAKAYSTKALALQLLSDLSYAETAQRGYVLTGADVFLQPYASLRETLLHDINTLIGVSFDDPEVAGQAASLAEFTHERLEELNLVIRLRDQQGREAAVSRVAAGRGHQIMEQVRDLSGKLLARQEANIAMLASEQRGRVLGIRITMALLVLGIVVLIISMAWLIAAYLRQRELAEKQMRSSMVRQLALFDGSLDALVIADSEGNIQSVNPSAQRMFNVGPTDIAGKNFVTLISSEAFPGRSPVFVDVLSHADGGGSVVEVSAVRQGGEVFPAELALSEINQSDSPLYIAAFRDVTERRRADQAKREFISTVSHELRTPLTSISGALKLFIHTRGKDIPPEAMRLIDIADRNAQRLAKLVNDILDIDKLEAGKMVFSDAEAVLEDIVSSAIDAISPFARDNDVAMQLVQETAHTTLQTDSLRLSQALTNLLSNAIKFSPAGSIIQIKTTLHGSCARVAIVDQGPGIPEDFIPRVFSKFSQASSSTLMHKGGTGLGLSIVKEIVERLGGQVSFETSASGTAFYIDLPRSGDPADSNVRI